MLIRLPFKERLLCAKVASIYSDVALRNPAFEDRARTFWRISVYIKFGFLSKFDCETLIVAMETFADECKKHPERDHTGEFKEVGAVVKKLKIICS